MTTCSRFGRPSAVISGSAFTSAARTRPAARRRVRADQREVELSGGLRRRQTPVTALIASTNCSAVIRRIAGPRKTYASGRSATSTASRLVRARREDHGHRALEVVAVRDQILGQPVEQVRIQAGCSMSSTGSTRPRPMNRAQRRLTIVRASRPFFGPVRTCASCSSRRSRGGVRVDRCPAPGTGTSSARSCPSAYRTRPSPAARRRRSPARP